MSTANVTAYAFTPPFDAAANPAQSAAQDRAALIERRAAVWAYAIIDSGPDDLASHRPG